MLNVDITGVAPENNYRDNREYQVIVNQFGDACIIPDYAPFYRITGISVKVLPDDPFLDRPILQTERWVDLSQDEMYRLTTPVLPYISAFTETDMGVYGAVLFNGDLLNRTLKLTYQCLGTDHINQPDIYPPLLTNIGPDIEELSWEVFLNLRRTFPDIIGVDIPKDETLVDGVITSLIDIGKKISDANTKFNLTKENKHLTNFNNPHKVSKSDIGLGKVVNLPPANYQRYSGVTDNFSYIGTDQLKVQILKNLPVPTDVKPGYTKFNPLITKDDALNLTDAITLQDAIRALNGVWEEHFPIGVQDIFITDWVMKFPKWGFEVMAYTIEDFLWAMTVWYDISPIPMNTDIGAFEIPTGLTDDKKINLGDMYAACRHATTEDTTDIPI